MFDQRVLNPRRFTVPDEKRKSTDVCCTIIGAIFAITMFIVACTMWNKDRFQNKFFNFSNAGNGKHCQKGYVYSTDANDFSGSTCVSNCPANFFAQDGLCLPTDQKLRNKYLDNPNISSPFDFNNFKQTLLWSSLVALGFGLLWMTLTHCAPRLAPMIAYILGAILCLAIGILILVLWDKFWSANTGLKIFVAIVCFILFIILIVMFVVYKNQMRMQGFFLQYATRFLNEHPYTFIYIPVFMLLAVCLIALIVWQHSCFSGAMGSSNNFWNFNNVGFWQILNILQLFWGLQFLRDAFNFCVSGNAVDWYWINRDRGDQKAQCYGSYSRFIFKHWGSVVGGSFLNAFFQIPTLIIQLLTCHPKACCPSLGTCCYNKCNCFTCFFDLVRTDAYSYINMSGIPFCNSARQCKKICQNSDHFVGSHSAMKHYRFAAHVLCVAAVFLMTWFILRKRMVNPSFWHYFVLIIVIYAIVTWFIDIHADAAEGLQTSYLSEYQLQRDHSYMHQLDPDYREDFRADLRRDKKSLDGHC